ncbi:IclR family transcriptional regulator [Ancylobacter sp. A5.8]|uniref:IclR family transcriptional regulator n=1 Tax=Ancylobacter gelatini TaxID=2919920 RepID=UPI001F4D523D|nr:IclR family transcriptional regulator [Ancylobacter gelatini]MCJ8144008.1 IclR family transcriptional regulator [Ancylobacter gelatini]
MELVHDQPLSASRLDASGTVARALAVLRTIADAGGEVGVKQVSDALHLPMSTAHRLLDLLSAEGYVERDPERRRYRAGLEWLRVSNRILSQESLPRLAAPILADLARESDETALLALHQPASGAMIFAAKADSPQPLRYEIDMYVRLPLVWGASGLAILAFLGVREQQAVMGQPQRRSASDGSFDEASVRERLTEVAARGYALTRGEKVADAVGIAVPLRVSGSGVVGSLGLTIPASRYEPLHKEVYVASLKAAASRLLARAG